MTRYSSDTFQHLDRHKTHYKFLTSAWILVLLVLQKNEKKPFMDNMIISLNNSNASSSGGSIDMRLNDIDPNFERVKGLKEKDNVQKSGGRLKPWHEKIGKRTKVVSRPYITQEISVDLTVQTPMKAPSYLDKDEFVNFFSNSQPPPQN
ncbi:hypothetical protein HYC85_012362 [Camellia sinensis]|uniref:Uncharacterized protein n=1 Tax=Camellia sinensis TaxID=4442 RepID=A0A7J7HCC1_CAMSI|nr:hypothetical protein HYC85_012362 [Camellia sinensis]